jgi:hypothetical protein
MPSDSLSSRKATNPTHVNQATAPARVAAPSPNAEKRMLAETKTGCIAPPLAAAEREREHDRREEEEPCVEATHPPVAFRLPGRVLATGVDPLTVEREEPFEEERQSPEREDRRRDPAEEARR